MGGQASHLEAPIHLGSNEKQYMPLEIGAPSIDVRRGDSIVVGLINNMPDAAVTATEQQFASLLSAASGPRQVQLRLSHIAEIPREPQLLERFARYYWPLEVLLANPLDAIIVTGTEPRAASLEEEPYWPQLCDLLEWVQSRSISSIWSCLAAHAAVQALDGISRHRLPEKRFGVFHHLVTSDTPLLNGVSRPLLTPHSRWNELLPEELRDAGYTLVSSSPENGADVFLRHDRGLFICFQGHPEYESTTLLKEYRRDVGRFLRGERDGWPPAPAGYLTPEALEQLFAFRRRAEECGDPDLLEQFPIIEPGSGITANWRHNAVRIYSNWLTQLADTRTAARCRASVQV